jgi:two-component sensor histidine kinase
VTAVVAADRHKDLLVAEMAHRIKNSLSVIGAFLSLEISRGLAPCRESYRAMQTRLAAVASLYDLIARSNAFGPVDMRTYLSGIGNGLRASLLGQDGAIQIAVDAEPLSIGADHAV